LPYAFRASRIAGPACCPAALPAWRAPLGWPPSTQASHRRWLSAVRREPSLAGFAAKIRSYCDRGDPVCALGHNLAAHFGLTVTYNQTASRFVLGRLRAAGIS
jgi:hypothetical protein